MKYLILLLSSFMTMANVETVEKFGDSKVKNASFTIVAPKDIQPNSDLLIKITGSDLSASSFNLDYCDFVGVDGDVLKFKVPNDVAIPSGMNLSLKTNLLRVNGDVNYGLYSVQGSVINYYNEMVLRYKLISSIGLVASDGSVTLSSDADHYDNGFYHVSFDISDRESFSAGTVINSPLVFDNLNQDARDSYKVTIKNAKSDGLALPVKSEYLFNVESPYYSYNVSYGYASSNSDWYSFYKLQNTTQSNATVTAKVYYSNYNSTQLTLCNTQEFSVNSIGVKNLSGADLIVMCGDSVAVTKHLNVTFYSKVKLIVDSQNSSPNGRTVNIVK
jgi:hypothetical protein